MNHSEADEQVALFEWADIARCIYPELSLLFHIPNGGSRHIVEAVNLKRQGTKAGIPDICLPVARGKFHGMFIEMKSEKGKVSDCQKDWLSRLHNQNYYVVVCRSWTAAKDEILKYLGDIKVRHL